MTCPHVALAMLPINGHGFEYRCVECKEIIPNLLLKRVDVRVPEKLA